MSETPTHAPAVETQEHVHQWRTISFEFATSTLHVQVQQVPGDEDGDRGPDPGEGKRAKAATVSGGRGGKNPWDLTA